MKKTRQEDYEEIIISHRKIEEINLQPFIAAKELVKDFEIGHLMIRPEFPKSLEAV